MDPADLFLADPKLATRHWEGERAGMAEAKSSAAERGCFETEATEVGALEAGATAFAVADSEAL